MENHEQEQISAKEQYELKKQERLSRKESVSQGDRNKNTGKKIRNWLIFIVIIALLGWGISAIVKSYSPQGEDLSRAIPSAGRDHINIGTGEALPPDTYTSNPPSSGPHYPNTARTGFYTEPVEDQFIVHNLEHGDIWIAYHPRILDKHRNELEDLAGQFVIVSPRLNNEFDISLVAWGRLDSFNLEDDAIPEERIRDFILRYDNKGPEQVRGAGGHNASSFN